MARSVFTDYLQVYPFWLMDIASIDPLETPVLNPALGFAQVAAPELSMEPVTIEEGNWPIDRFVLKRGNIGSLNIQRAVAFQDSDFWQWSMAALFGNSNGFAVGGKSPRRNLLLIHHFSRNPYGDAVGAFTSMYGGGLQMVGGVNSAIGNAGNLIGVGTAGVQERLTGIQNRGVAAGSPLSPGPFEAAARVPARAYLLKSALPVRYKPTSDFAANDSSIALAELDIQIEGFEEVNLAGGQNSPQSLVTKGLQKLTQAKQMVQDARNLYSTASDIYRSGQNLVAALQAPFSKTPQIGTQRMPTAPPTPKEIKAKAADLKKLVPKVRIPGF